MTRIFFGTHLSNIDSTLDTLAKKLLQQKAGAFIVAPDERCEAVDRALWQKPQLAFLPHALFNDPLAQSFPLIIASTALLSEIRPDHDSSAWHYQHLDGTRTKRSVLINFEANPLPIFARFKQLIELIPDANHPPHCVFSSTKTAIHEGRHRFRHYRERGYDLTHNQSLAQWLNAAA